jgi:hypothetical protein
MKNKSSIQVLFLLSFIIFNSFQNTYSFSSSSFNKEDSLGNIQRILSPVVNQTFTDLKVPGAIIGVYMGASLGDPCMRSDSRSTPSAIRFPVHAIMPLQSSGSIM